MIGIGGMARARYAGPGLDTIGACTPTFVVAASAYLIPLAVIHLLTPRLVPVAL